MDESVTTHVKKCVWLSRGTAWVIILLISHAAVTVWRVCALKVSPEATGLWGAQDVTVWAGEESS